VPANLYLPDAKTIHPVASAPPGIAASLRGLPGRLLNWRGSVLFVRNAAASGVSFLLDLALLWAMVSELGWNKLIAAAGAFVVANAVHYLIARKWVFHESDQGMVAGYGWFLVNALAGLAIVMVLFALLSGPAGIPYLIARVIASLCAGTVVFALNAILNFRLL
jgi:putative flippase GtrA